MHYVYENFLSSCCFVHTAFLTHETERKKNNNFNSNCTTHTYTHAQLVRSIYLYLSPLGKLKHRFYFSFVSLQICPNTLKVNDKHPKILLSVSLIGRLLWPIRISMGAWCFESNGPTNRTGLKRKSTPKRNFLVVFSCFYSECNDSNWALIVMTSWQRRSIVKKRTVWKEVNMVDLSFVVNFNKSMMELMTADDVMECFWYNFG